ncbi:mediator of RNA polymerase II transcription subunit 1-like [Liolophura sinensis]|uniref:mediator of RNA polymerase II transcription subunit 1-like n=1 Tax=Liolophura sinensis TaxID=3198878 RepID=UPI0031580351
MAEEQELSALMERLRGKCVEQRSWADSIKALRSVVTQEKRHLAETLDRIHIQRCLDTLQSAIKVFTQQSMLARLRCISRQTGLNFSEKLPNSAVLSSDMFYVEVYLDPEKAVRDVRIAHQGEATSCPELLRLLSAGEFTQFTKHLEGLSMSYQIVGDKKQRTKAFHALQSLETDLNLLAQLQSSINGVGNYIHKSPLGILIPRNGGLPMKLIYFVSPYDLLNKTTKAAHPMTVEAIMEHELGHSVTVCLDSFSNTKLQTMPLMTVNTLQEGKSLPSFSALSNMNSCTLPACFVLRLPKAIPLALSVVKKICSLTNVDMRQGMESRSLLSLIVEDMSGGEITSVQELFVTLPDQQHRYYLQEGCGLGEQQGVMVSKIHFTHPTHVPQILVHLRQQLLFNALIGSCVRPSAKKEDCDSMVFEVTALSLQHVCVTFEHPLQEAMATVELDLSDITSVKCRVLCVGETEPFVSDDHATKVFQRCLSVPVTMRAILMKVLGQLRKQMAEDKLRSSQREKQKASRHITPLMIPTPYGMDIAQKGISGPVLQHQNSAPLPHPYQSRTLSDLLDPSSASPELLDSIKAEKVAKNPMLASLLDQEPGVQESDSPMLSKLLDDQAPTVTSLPPSRPGKPRKNRKRKPDPLFGSSPKHRASEDGMSDRSLELETPSPLDVKLPGPLPGNPSATVIDLTGTESAFIGESHVSKLAHTVNKIIVDSTKSDSLHLTEPAASPEMANIVNNIEQKTESVAVWQESKEHGIKRTSLSELWGDSMDSDGPVDPDLFTNKSSSSMPMKIKRSTSRQSSASQQSDRMEFDTELLNADPNFSDSLIDNSSEGMGLDACDASAFGVGINPVVEMASKLASSSASTKSATSKAVACDGTNSKFTSASSKAGLKRRVSDSGETTEWLAGKVKFELDASSQTWKKPDSDLLNARKNSECDVSNIPRRKVENDLVFPRKSDSDSCLYRKKSESDIVNKKLSVDTESSGVKKADNDVSSKKRTESDSPSVSKKKPDGHSSESSHSSKKKESEGVSVKKRFENESPSANKKKTDSDSSSSSRERAEGEGVSPMRRKLDSDLCNSSKRRSEVDGSMSARKTSEETGVDPGGTSPSKQAGIKMKISRQYEGRSVSSPLQVLDLSKNSKNNSKSSKDGSLDNNKGGLAMAVTSVAYSSPALSGSKSPLINSSISPSKTSTLSHSTKSPSSHHIEKNNRSSKMERSKKTKHSSSSESSKRKRDKEEYRREKKKKRLEELHYQPSVRDDTFYQSTQVNYPGVNDKKQMPKLKITKRGDKVTVTSSSKSSGSIFKTVTAPRKSSQASYAEDDAFSFSGSEGLEKEELSRKLSQSRLSHPSSGKSSNSVEKSSSSSQKSSHKSSQRSTSKNITVSKADSKLMTKTPTIKLKPIVIPTAGASVTVGAPRGPGSNVQSSPQSAPVSTTLSKSNSQSPYASPAHSSPRSATPTSVTPTGLLSPGTTPTTPPIGNKNGVSIATAPSSASGTSQNTNKIKSPGRLRKGSLSAVIDKLTKSSAITSGPKSEGGEESLSRVKVLAAVVSQQSNQVKSSNSNISNNSLCREHKSPSKQVSGSSNDRGGSDVEKVKTLYNSMSSLLKESSPRKDKADYSPQRSKSDSVMEKNSPRKSSGSQDRDRDRQKPCSNPVNSSCRSGKEDGRKGDNWSSRKSHSGSSGSGSSSSPGNLLSSSSGNSLGATGGGSALSASGNSQSSSVGNGESNVGGSHRSSPLGASPTCLGGTAKDKIPESSEKNSKVHKSGDRQHISKSATKSTAASSASGDKHSPREDDTGKLLEDKHATSSICASSKGSQDIVSQEAKCERRVEVDTPASPTEEKEHRSAEETAKIPVLERLQLEYTQESSNSPKSKGPGRPEPQEKGRHRTSLAGLLDQEGRKVVENEVSDRKSAELEVSPQRTNVLKATRCARVNGETELSSDSHSATVLTKDTLSESFRSPTPVLAQPPDPSRPDPNGADQPSPKSKKPRSSSSSNCNSQPVPSPHSDASSPGNGLVIDCPSTPTGNSLSVTSPPSLPKPEPVPPQPVPRDKTTSPVTKVSPGPSPKLHRRSPTPSPVIKAPSNPGSVAPSPVEIDDDLMDDVVLGMGS